MHACMHVIQTYKHAHTHTYIWSDRAPSFGPVRSSPQARACRPARVRVHAKRWRVRPVAGEYGVMGEGGGKVESEDEEKDREPSRVERGGGREKHDGERETGPVRKACYIIYMYMI
jgi:hypothetical protein